MEMEEEPQKLFEKGVAMLKRGYPGDAVDCLEKALEKGFKSSACYSWLGLAYARSGRKIISKAEELCMKAIKMDFVWSQYYLNLAEVYVIWGKKEKAIKTLEEGLKIDRDNTEILNELERLGVRRRSLLPFLPRSNPINKYLGKILYKVGLRR